MKWGNRVHFTMECPHVHLLYNHRKMTNLRWYSQVGCEVRKSRTFYYGVSTWEWGNYVHFTMECPHEDTSHSNHRKMTNFRRWFARPQPEVGKSRTFCSGVSPRTSTLIPPQNFRRFQPYNVTFLIRLRWSKVPIWQLALLIDNPTFQFRP